MWTRRLLPDTIRMALRKPFLDCIIQTMSSQPPKSDLPLALTQTGKSAPHTREHLMAGSADEPAISAGARYQTAFCPTSCQQRSSARFLNGRAAERSQRAVGLVCLAGSRETEGAILARVAPVRLYRQAPLSARTIIAGDDKIIPQRQQRRQ